MIRPRAREDELVARPERRLEPNWGRHILGAETLDDQAKRPQRAIKTTLWIPGYADVGAYFYRLGLRDVRGKLLAFGDSQNLPDAPVSELHFCVSIGAR